MANKTFLQTVKFTLFSASAGIIQIGSFAIINELFGLNENVKSEYWIAYLPSLILSVLWNFTLNRQYTFKSATNVPIAMAKIFGFYLIFTPLSTILGNISGERGINEYIILAVTMLSNFVLEFLFCKLVVYRNNEDTLKKPKNKE